MPDPQLLAHCQARLGSVVGDRWRLDSLLGMGGMAAVYVGTHTIGRREAIKILHPFLAGSPDIVARFEREARAVNAFHHPGAVDIRDLGRTPDGCPFLVMELLDGETLGQRVNRLGTLPREELLRFADELLDVLGAAHASGIIHRDLKLENLFVTREGRLKVLDFGIAHVAGQRRITQLGDVIGTLSYMAPEQVAGEGIDARTDLFSVGVVLFRVLAGRRVHAAQSEESLVLAMGTTQAPEIRSVSPDVDPALAAVIDRALRFRKEERFQSAAEMRQALRACWAAAPGPVAAAHPTPARKRAPLLAVVALVGVAVLGAALFFGLRRTAHGESEDDSDATGESDGAKPKKKKKKKKSASASGAPAATSTAAASAQPTATTPPESDFGPQPLDLEKALPIARAATEKQFGATKPLTKFSVTEYTVIVGTVTADDPTHVDEFIGQLFTTPVAFRDFGHSTRDPAKVVDGAFSLEELPLDALSSMLRDAQGRIKDRSAKLGVLTCGRLLQIDFSAQHKAVQSAPLRCAAVTSSKYGSEVFNYLPNGTFFDPSAPRPPGPHPAPQGPSGTPTRL